MTGGLKIGHKIIIGVVFALLVFLFWRFFSSSGDSSLDQGALIEVREETLAGALVGHDLLAALGKLRSVSLDVGFFSDLTFQSLKDRSVSIFPQPVGRRNPFSPTGSESSTKVGSPVVPLPR